MRTITLMPLLIGLATGNVLTADSTISFGMLLGSLVLAFQVWRWDAERWRRMQERIGTIEAAQKGHDIQLKAMSEIIKRQEERK